MNTDEQNKHARWESSPTIHDLVILTGIISRYKWFFSAACIALFLSCFYAYHTHTYYSSRITFLVNSSNIAEVLWDHSSETPIDVMTDDRGYNRINQIVNSSQMIDYLIDKFDLYTHYGIPKGNTDSYLNVANTLKKHLAVSINKSKIITVQVSDRLDYNVAANMANAIGKKINDINRQITIDNLSRKTEMFEALSKDLRSSSSREFNQMDSLLKSMQRFIAGAVQDAGYRQLLSMNIENIQSKSEDYFKNLFESYKYRLYSMYSLQEKNLPTISVLEKALPDKSSKSEYNVIVYPLLIIFSVLITAIFTFFIVKMSPLAGYILQKSGELKKK